MFFIYLASYLSIYLSIYLSAYLPIYLFIHLFIHLFVYCLFIYLFIYCFSKDKTKIVSEFMYRVWWKLLPKAPMTVCTPCVSYLQGEIKPLRSLRGFLVTISLNKQKCNLVFASVIWQISEKFKQNSKFKVTPDHGMFFPSLPPVNNWKLFPVSQKFKSPSFQR